LLGFARGGATPRRYPRRSFAIRLAGALALAAAASVAAGAAPAAAGPDTPAAPLRLDLIDTPTAQVLPRGAYDVTLRLLGDGAALIGTRVGLFDPFTFGVHYGGSNVLGGGDPDWNPRIEFSAKLRLLREGTLPAVAIGFDSQGLGHFDDMRDRYEVKSRGVYGAVGKTYPLLGSVELHGGASVSLEDGDGDNGLTLFGGVEKSVGSVVVFLLEYDIATNDDKKDGVYGRGRGYLNASVSWAASEVVSLDLQLRNLVENGELDDSLGDWNREVRIRLMEFF
jgi:hypothetical protein